MNSPVTIADFCTFTIVEMEQRADDQLLKGRLSRPGQLSRGERYCLYMNPSSTPAGLLVDFSPDQRFGSITIKQEQYHDGIEIGAQFRLIKSYVRSNVLLAMDTSLVWTRTRFEPSDAFSQPAQPGWRMSRKVQPDDEATEEIKIIPGGWDHEHCQFCMQKIGTAGDVEGYVSNTDRWICVPCYTRIISRRDLEFALLGWPDHADENNLAYAHIQNLIYDYDLDELNHYFDSGGMVDARNRNGWTPLMLAASKGHESLVNLLLNRGADVNAVSKQHGDTAIALAAADNHEAVVRSLLNAGASVDIGSLSACVQSGSGRDNPEIMRMLKDADTK